jgi:hypothetical protein
VPAGGAGAAAGAGAALVNLETSKAPGIELSP